MTNYNPYQDPKTGKFRSRPKQKDQESGLGILAFMIFCLLVIGILARFL